MKICSTCKNLRFIIQNDRPFPCEKCNSKGKYSLKEEVICLGCGKTYPCPSDCPCGTCKLLLIQN